MEEKSVLINGINVTVKDQGAGRPFLLLHGGGGPLTVGGFGDLLASQRQAHVLTPTHPGFAGTSRPEALATVRDLATTYTGLLQNLGLAGVTVVGNSIGGWIAAEMALVDATRIGRLVLVDAVGIEVPGHPVVDFFSLTPREVAEHSYFDPDKYGIDPTKLPQAAREAMAGNRAALTTYAGAAMKDSSLAGRLAGVRVPTLVLWGDSDRIADANYGRAFAAAIPGAEFKVLPMTGHLPQIETPDKLLEEIWSFAEAADPGARVR